MSCKTITLGDGISITSCGRGAHQPSSRRSCSRGGCKAAAENECGYLLHGAAEGKACGRAICKMHTVKESEIDPAKTGDRVLCPPHVAMTRAKRGA